MKALAEISSLLAKLPYSDAEALYQMMKQIMPEWAQSLNRLSVDFDRRIREKTFLVFFDFFKGPMLAGGASKNLKKLLLTPYLKLIMGSWLCALNDSEKEVRAAAKMCFDVSSIFSLYHRY